MKPTKNISLPLSPSRFYRLYKDFGLTSPLGVPTFDSSFTYCVPSNNNDIPRWNTKNRLWLGSAILCLAGLLGYTSYTHGAVNNPTAMKQENAAEKICPVLYVEALLEECVYQVNNGRTFSSYIDEIISIVQNNRALFIERFPHLDSYKLLEDLKSIRDSRSAMKIAWKLWNYWPLLPESFWNLGTWERKKLIEQRLRY